MTNTEHAKSVLNDPERKTAWLQWNHKPMEISDKEFELAMDWAEALLCLSAASAE